MSYTEELKRKLQTGSMENVRAVIYARVSTENEGQKESCSNQVALAHGYLAGHPNVSLVATYIDDGLSGKNDFTRPEYNEMLNQLSSDSFDLIITKSLSRLNRNELNSLLLNNMLIEHNATILTLEDNQIHDFEDMNSGIFHSIKYAMDAQFVKQQSINGRKTQELRCERKELSAKDCSFGYDWNREDKSITINEEQAEVVRRIFEEYVYRNATPASIQRALKTEGISVCGRTITNIIKDERYIGKFYINKRTSKLGTGRTKSKRISLPKEQWVLCERPDLQIVDTDLFVMAQRVHKNRVTVYETPDKKVTRARFMGTHKYARKIFCPDCGKPYQFGYADRQKTRPMYYIKRHSECTNPVRRIYEQDLEEITRRGLKHIFGQENEACLSVERILTEVVKASQDNGGVTVKLKKQVTAKETQLDNLMDRLAEDGLTEASKIRIKAKINNLSKEIDELEAHLRKIENNKLDNSYITEKISSIRTAIANLKEFSSIDRDRVMNYIERIDMLSNGDVELLLKSGHIIIAEDNHPNDFSDGSVSKNGNQDILDSYLAYKHKKILLTSFPYPKSIHGKYTQDQTVNITVRCFLKVETEKV